ncbi:MAG: hypothetical protein E7350_03115 [Clostridiales bacterium]|nr:hypothetical protein [Clostridiales bacterium]
MKKLFGIFALMLVAIMAFACLGCPAPNPDDDTPAFTIKVIGLDDQAVQGMQVQVCKYVENGGGACYAYVPSTDKNGVVTFDYGDDMFSTITDTTATALEVHLQNLPDNITYDLCIINKGESKTIKLRLKTDADLNQAASGDGTGSYVEDTTIDAESFSPYAVAEGTYRLKFTTAGQKIYFAYTPSVSMSQRVTVLGGLNVKITQLSGDAENGIVNSGEATKSISGEDCEYVFAGTRNAVAYFEVELMDSEGLNVDGYITFNYKA